MLTRRETQLHCKSTQQGLPKLILNKNVNNNLNQSLQTNFDLWTNSKKTFWLKNQITNHFSQLKSIWNKESIAYKNQRCKTKKERNRIRKRVKSSEPLRTRTKRERERAIRFITINFTTPHEKCTLINHKIQNQYSIAILLWLDQNIITMISREIFPRIFFMEWFSDTNSPREK